MVDGGWRWLTVGGGGLSRVAFVDCGWRWGVVVEVDDGGGG